MSDPSMSGGEVLPPELGRRLDEVCNRFEAVWRSGGRPNIEDYAVGWEGAARAALLRELAALDADYRRLLTEAGQPKRAADRGGAVPEPTPSRPTADRNLLFGILALQMDFISRDALIQAMNAWVLDKAKPLGQILQEQDQLTPQRLQLLHALVQEHLNTHHDDPQQSLAALSSVSPVRHDLQRLGDADLDASLASLAVVGSARAGNPDATVDGSGATREGTLAGFRYRVLRPHAKGGLGEVSVAEDLELHREVALKEIQTSHAHDPVSRGRFLLEAEVTGRLEHPGIVPIYGLGQYADGRPFYAMRFIRGDNLKDAIRRFHAADTPTRDPSERSLAFRELLARFVDVCNAVAYAHSRGILHRDLKPGNIMLGKYGETLVVDWGLSKSIDRPESLPTTEEATLKPSSGGAVAATKMGSAIGTPAYMSPEQAAGRLDLLGPASDIYSLGATLYVLLTGRAPFRDAEVGEVLAKVQRGELLTPRQIQPAISAPLEAICLKAMALRPEQRYATALALAADIEHWLADEPVQAWPEPWTMRLRRQVQRHRTVVTAAAAALSVALVSLGVATMLLSTANQQLRQANALVEANYQEAERQKGDAQQAAEREREARTLAQANYQRAREAVDQYLTKVAENPRLRVGGLRQLRRELLEEAGKFYTQFIQERGDNRELREDLARAYAKSAFIASESGADAQAIERSQQARSILEKLVTDHPDVPQYQVDLALISTNLGTLHANTGQGDAAWKSFEQARTVREKLAAAYPDVPDYQTGLAVLYDVLAGQQQVAGQREAALKSYEQARAIREKLVADHPGNAGYQNSLASTYSSLGNVHMNSGRQEIAGSYYEQARTIQEQLVTAHPSEPLYRSSLARTYSNLGYLQQGIGQREAALQSHERTRTLREQLVADHPDVPQYRYELANTYRSLGNLQQSIGQREAALKFYEQARAIREQLVADHPDFPRYQNELAGAYGSLGNLQQGIGQREAALKSYEQARAIQEKLVADHPNLLQYQTDLAFTYRSLGNLQQSIGQREAALGSYEQARTLQEKLVAAHPDIPRYRYELGVTYFFLGNLGGGRGKPEEKLLWYDKAIPLLEAVRHPEPAYSSARQMLRTAHAGRARAMTDLGRHAEALKDWDRALELETGPDRYASRLLRAATLARLGQHTEAAAEAKDLAQEKNGAAGVLYSAACVYSLSSMAVRRDAQLPQAEQERLGEHHAVRAVEFLNKAQAAGYFQAPARVAQLKKDPDLDPLRSRPDFQKLLQELESQTEPPGQR